MHPGNGRRSLTFKTVEAAFLLLRYYRDMLKIKRSQLFLALAALVLSTAGLACKQSGMDWPALPFWPTHTATWTPTFTCTVTPSQTFTPLPTDTPTATATFTLTPSPTATWTPTSTNTPRPRPTNPPLPTAPPGSAGYAGQVIALVNNERAANGLSALTINWTLMSNSQAWSEYMAYNNIFDHSGQNVGENVAAGYATPGDAVAAWMSSEGHRANILNPSYTQVGAGYAYSQNSTYQHYWTLQFLP
jgi:uncharacterized protein YkwD